MHKFCLILIRPLYLFFLPFPCSFLVYVRMLLLNAVISSLLCKSTALSRALYAKSKPRLLRDWPFTANQFVLASGPLSPTTRVSFFFSTEHLRQWSLCNIFSNKRLSLSFTIVAGSRQQSFSGPSSAGLKSIFCCLRFETPSIWRARSRCLYPAGTG
jgi:hypothetical protein